jgi:hypothetical protein
MFLSEPMPFVEAIGYLIRKALFPTAMTTAELRELDAEFRERSFFSAQNLFEGVLKREQEVIESILNPRQVKRADRVTAQNPEGWVTEGFNPATARVEIRKALEKAGYSPQPEDAGTIKYLSSEQRLNLVIETNEKLAHGKGSKQQGETETLKLTRPAWELYRQEERVKKRAWLDRFRLAGEQSGRALNDGWTITPDERMVALKGHPIWEKLGSSALFDDSLDVDHPPFAFNSGMWWREVRRAEVFKLGIVPAMKEAA